MKNELFTRIALSFFTTLSVSFSTHAKILSESEYPFPIKDPYISSISSGANLPLAPYKIIKVEVRTDRRHVPLLEGRNAVPLGLFEQKNKTAPLAFVISGTGGTALSGTALYLASDLYLKGYHVVTLPDPISWHYVLGVSETSLPGDPLRDASEYYRFLQTVTEFLKNKINLKYTHVSLSGYSYGGLICGFLALEDAAQKVFNFNRIIILNPPMNTKHSLLLLDQYYDEGKKISRDRKDIILGSILNVAEEMLDHGFDLNIVGAAINKLKLSTTESQWLIGESFRNSLAEVVYTSQQIFDLHILKQEANSWHKRERLAESKTIGYREYFIQFVAPSLMSNRVAPSRDILEALLNKSNFYALEEILKTNKNIYVFTNKDDFLISPPDVEFLKSTLQDRLYLYPYGGHLGNIWFPINRADFTQVMGL